MTRTSCENTASECQAKRRPLSIPPHSRSAGRREGGCGGGGQRRIVTASTMAARQPALKFQPAPPSANTAPARAGPRARAVLYEMLITDTAWGRSSRGTASATAEFQDGDISALQQPQTKTSQSSSAGPTQPARASAASRAAAAALTTMVRTMSRPRSVMSPSTPAGSASRNIGRNTAVCTSAARKDEPVSSTISHAAAVVCIAEPMK